MLPASHLCNFENLLFLDRRGYAASFGDPLRRGCVLSHLLRLFGLGSWIDVVEHCHRLNAFCTLIVSLQGFLVSSKGMWWFLSGYEVVAGIRYQCLLADRGATVHFDIRQVSGGRTGAVASRTGCLGLFFMSCSGILQGHHLQLV